MNVRGKAGGSLPSAIMISKSAAGVDRGAFLNYEKGGAHEVPIHPSQVCSPFCRMAMATLGDIMLALYFYVYHLSLIHLDITLFSFKCEHKYCILVTVLQDQIHFDLRRVASSLGFHLH